MKPASALEIGILSVLASFVLLGAPARADDLGSVIDRYISWRGGSAFDKLASIHLQGVLKEDGLEGRYSLWADRDGRNRMDIDLGPLKQTHAVDRAGSWDISPSGQVETLSLADKQSDIRAAALQFSDAVRGRGGAKAVMLGTAVRDGRTWSIVRIGFGDEDSYDAFIDPTTGELDGFRITEDRQTRFEHFGDWRWLQGVRVPFLHATDDDTREAVTAVELNLPLPPEQLQRPTLPRKASFRDGSASTGWIQFETFGGNRIFLPVEVNGRVAMALLDSGATVSSVDKGWARSIGLTSQGGFTGAGTGGADTFGFIHGVDVEVGNLHLDKLTIASFDFSAVAKSIGRPVPFVLGDEVFNELLVDIDFAHERIAFREPPNRAAKEAGVEVPLLRIKDRAVPVSVEGAPAAPFEFDLGSGSPLQIFPSFETKHHLLDGRPASQTWFGGVGGYAPMDVAEVKQFTFAGEDFPGAPAVFTPDIRSGANSNLVQGNLGLPVYARLHLLIDFSHDRLWATPYSHAATTPFPKDRLGLYLSVPAKTLGVSLASPGSPAAKAGLKKGDSITTINGVPASDWTPNALRNLREGPAGALVTVVLDSGDVRRMALADFY